MAPAIMCTTIGVHTETEVDSAVTESLGSGATAVCIFTADGYFSKSPTATARARRSIAPIANRNGYFGE